MSRRTVGLAFVAATAAACAAHAGSLTLIPIPHGLEGHVFNTGVSGDGKVVTGYAPGGSFYWTAETGVVYNGGLEPGWHGCGGDCKVSADGLRMCGQFLDDSNHAIGGYYLRQEGVWVTQPSMGANCDITKVSAWNLSRDGQVVVGLGYYQTLCTERPCRWRDGESATLPLYTWFGWDARIDGCSADGRVMCGWQAIATGWWQGAAWVPNAAGTGWVQYRLADAAGHPMGEAMACSGNGQWVFGRGDFGDGVQNPYRWSVATKAVPLGPGGSGMFVSGANADGTIAAISPPGPLPSGDGSVWIEGRGFVALRVYAAEHGVTVPADVHLGKSMDISPDGLAICGVGSNSADGYDYTFVLDLHADAAACPADLDGDRRVDGADLGRLLGNWGGQGVGDLNGDGTVNGADLGAMLGAFGPCP